jgi:hypothetical protein
LVVVVQEGLGVAAQAPYLDKVPEELVAMAQVGTEQE